MQKKLNVVFITDKNYLQHLSVALTSLLENNIEIVDRIFLVHDIENNLLLSPLLDYINIRYTRQIELLKIDSTLVDGWNLENHLTKATYYRLFLADMIPSEVDKILFLDSDIVVNGSISNFLSLDFKKSLQSNEEYYLYAVDHQHTSEQLERLKELNFTSEKYFNAGIIYINLEKWRDDNVAKIFNELLNKFNKKLLWADQDILNLSFQDKWAELDYSYNAFGLSKKDNTPYKIIHFTGITKPWHFRSTHPYKRLYWAYLDKTPYKRHFSNDFTVINIMKWMIPRSIKEFFKNRTNR